MGIENIARTQRISSNHRVTSAPKRCERRTVQWKSRGLRNDRGIAGLGTGSLMVAGESWTLGGQPPHGDTPSQTTSGQLFRRQLTNQNHRCCATSVAGVLEPHAGFANVICVRSIDFDIEYLPRHEFAMFERIVVGASVAHLRIRATLRCIGPRPAELRDPDRMISGHHPCAHRRFVRYKKI